MILGRLGGTLPLGLIFIAVKNTGDFERKGNQKKLIWDIYGRLTSGVALLPTSVAFSFDREQRTEEEIADLTRDSRGRVHFLPRLTYENYLIDAEAIAAMLNDPAFPHLTKIEAASVENWLSLNGGKYVKKLSWAGDFTDVEWLKKVHAPSLLGDLFNELSEAKLPYQKTVHSVRLTEWLLAHRPDALSELADYISGLTPSLSRIAAPANTG